MAAHPTGKDVAGAVAPAFVLDRVDAIPKLVGRHEDFLIVFQKHLVKHLKKGL